MSGSRQDSSPLSWGSVGDIFVNLTVPLPTTRGVLPSSRPATQQSWRRRSHRGHPSWSSTPGSFCRFRTWRRLVATLQPGATRTDFRCDRTSDSCSAALRPAECRRNNALERRNQIIGSATGRPSGSPVLRTAKRAVPSVSLNLSKVSSATVSPTATLPLLGGRGWRQLSGPAAMAVLWQVLAVGRSLELSARIRQWIAQRAAC